MQQKTASLKGWRNMIVIILRSSNEALFQVSYWRRLSAFGDAKQIIPQKVLRAAGFHRGFWGG